MVTGKYSHMRFLHTHKLANGYTDEAAYQMADTDLPARGRPSSAARHQEETADCHILETAALIAYDLVETAGLYNLDLASFEDLEVAAAFHGQGTTLLEVADGWASVDFLGLNAVPFELDLSLAGTLGLHSLVGLPGWRIVEVHLKQFVGVADWKERMVLL